MSFHKQFKSKACSLALSAHSKEDALREVVELLVKGGDLAAEHAPAALAALLARESVASTGVGQNVAIPHVRIAGLQQTVASLCVHPAGVEWNAVDGDVVQLVFTVLRPDQPSDTHDPVKHLELMRWISKLARSPDFRSFALQAKKKSELLDLLAEMR